MKYQQFISDRTNPYGPPSRKQNNLNEKAMYRRKKDKGGPGDKVCFSIDNKECVVIDTIYQSELRSENEAGGSRFAKKFKVTSGKKLDGEDRKNLYDKSVTQCQAACINEVDFYCKSFNFKYKDDGKGDCSLSDW